MKRILILMLVVATVLGTGLISAGASDITDPRGIVIEPKPSQCR